MPSDTVVWWCLSFHTWRFRVVHDRISSSDILSANLFLVVSVWTNRTTYTNLCTISIYLNNQLIIKQGTTQAHFQLILGFVIHPKVLQAWFRHRFLWIFEYKGIWSALCWKLANYISCVHAINCFNKNKQKRIHNSQQHYEKIRESKQ